MYTNTEIEIEQEKELVVPPLPREAILCLPSYCRPTKNNLASQYYFWTRQLTKENSDLKKQVQKLNDENQQLKEREADLEKEKEQLRSERDKFREMLFRFKQRKHNADANHEPIQRTEESYVRKMPETIDEYKESLLKHCPHCNHKLSNKIDSYQRVIEDIPDYEQLKSKVIEYTIHRYYCKHCKKIISAKPKEALPKSKLGINTLLYVLHSKYRLRLSHDLIRENLNTQFNLKVSDGQITNLLEKGSLAFSKKWQEIIETIKNSKTTNSDETSWKIGKEKAGHISCNEKPCFRVYRFG